MTLHNAHSHLYMYIYMSCSVSKGQIVYCVYSLKSKIKILKLYNIDFYIARLKVIVKDAH